MIGAGTTDGVNPDLASISVARFGAAPTINRCTDPFINPLYGAHVATRPKFDFITAGTAPPFAAAASCAFGELKERQTFNIISVSNTISI